MPTEANLLNKNPVKNSQKDPLTLKDANPQAEIPPNACHPNMKNFV